MGVGGERGPSPGGIRGGGGGGMDFPLGFLEGAPTGILQRTYQCCEFWGQGMVKKKRKGRLGKSGRLRPTDHVNWCITQK